MPSTIVIAWSDVVAFAPELASLAADQQARALAAVAALVEGSRWTPQQLVEAQVYLAAHFGEMTRRASTGAVQSSTVGPLSVTYAVMMSPKMLDVTKGGQAYAFLVSINPNLRLIVS